MAGSAGVALGLMHLYKIVLLVLSVPLAVLFVVGTVNSIRALRQRRREYASVRARVHGLLTDASGHAFFEWAASEGQSFANSFDRRQFHRRVARAVREALAMRYRHGAEHVPAGQPPGA